ncbi:uncharacterized protein LOC143038381 isoform X2 [Oratosquilla oratoria]|uniref:uncharacterized protein LOC143038381 isoform X2 n=1 Tax=Oratosquilla oratoria TaxID=337810 RepID=UPI003F76C6E2
MAQGVFTLCQPTGTGQGFGTGQSTVATGSGGFSFGQPAQPTGASTPSLGFGAPAAPATGGGISFGTPATSTSGSIGLGMPAASSALTPSASTVMAGGGLLAAPSSVTSSGFGFGGSTAVPSTVEGSSLGMAPPLVSSGLSLGTATTSGSGGFSFAPSAPTSTVNTAPSTTTSVGAGFFGTSTVTTNSTKMGFACGTTTSTTPTTGLTLGQAAPPTTSATASGFSFGPTTTSSSISAFLSTPTSSVGTPLSAAAPAATSGLSGFSMSAGIPSTKPGGFGGESLVPASSAAALPSSASIGLGGAAPALQTVPSIGLGGAQPAPGQAGVNTAGQKPDGKSTKEIPLPQDIFTTLAVFEGHMNGEKAASEQNMRKTAAPFHKLDEETKKMRQLVTQLANQYTQLSSSAEKLKAQVMQEAKHVEMARRTQDTPVGLQTENKVREEYFAALVHSFEQRMIYCRTKIEEVERCLQATNNNSTTPDDVKEVMRREHDTMKTLAGQVYQLHTKLLLLCDQVKSSAVPSPQVLFRPQAPAPKSELPPSAELRPCLAGGGSALKEFQAGQQKAKAWSLGAAPPTLPLSQTSAPSLFGGTGNAGQKGLFASNQVFYNNPMGSSFASGSLFSPATSSAFGASNSLASNTANQSSLFNFSSSFNSKPFGESSEESSRKRRL